MARRRMIDPNIWQSEDFAGLSMLAKLVFIGMFSLADDEGKGRAKPAYIKSVIFPYDDGMRIIDVEKTLSEIGSNMSVTFYAHDGKSYYKLNNWEKWQRVDKPQASKIPDPELVQNDSGMIPELVQNDSVLKEKKGKEEEKKGKEYPPTPQGGEAAYFENQKVEQAFREFIENRRLIKSPMTGIGIKKAVSKLKSLSSNPSVQIEIINQSIEGNWKGLFPLKRAQNYDPADEWANEIVNEEPEVIEC